MYSVLSHEAPEYISNLYTLSPSRYSNSRNYQLSLSRPRIDIFKTGISFSGAYLWNSLPLTVRSCQSLSFFRRKLRAHLEVHRMDCDIIPPERERERERGFRVIAIAMTGHLKPILYIHKTPPSPAKPLPPPPPPLFFLLLFLPLPYCCL